MIPFDGEAFFSSADEAVFCSLAIAVSKSGQRSLLARLPAIHSKETRDPALALFRRLSSLLFYQATI